MADLHNFTNKFYHLLQDFWGPLVGIVLLIILICRDVFGEQALRVISAPLNLWLSRKYRVVHTETGRSLPGPGYSFPDGQGDSAKFLHGKENSLKWESQYGPIYRIWSGATPEVVVTKAEHIQAVFRDSDKHLKAVNNNSGFILSQLLGKCVGLVSQDEWKTLRTISEVPFLRTTAPTYLTLVRKRTLRHFKELGAQENLQNGLIDPAQDLKMLPFWIIADVIYGELSREFERILSELAPLREAVFRNVISGGLSRFEWSQHLPTEANRDLNKFKARWTKFNRDARNRALRLGTRPPVVDLYDAIAAGTITQEHLLHTMDEVLYANLDVTLGGISWNLVFLAAHPECQQRIRDEVFEWRRNPKGGDFDGYFLDSTTYLSACILEASRLRPLAAFSVPQAIPTDRMVGGYYFPRGTNFIVDAYALNQRNDFWGKDTMSYKPERHLTRSATKSRYNFWRFGFGPRQCMGKYVADMMMRVLMVHMVENYELRLTEDQEKEWARDPQNWINHPQMKLRCLKRDG